MHKDKHGYSKYLNQLELDWQRAESDAEWNVGQQVHCALTYTSIHNHINNLQSREILSNLKIGDERQQIDFLIALATHLPAEENTDVIDYALTLVERSIDVSLQAHSLKVLVPYLNAKQKDKASKMALSIAETLNDKEKLPYIFADLAPYLSPPYLAEALNSVQVITDERNKSEVLGQVAPYIPEKMMPDLLAAVHAIENDYPQSVAVGKLAPHLSPVWLEKLLDITKGIDDSRNRADALRDIGEHLPAELMGTALEVAQGIEDIHYLAWAFRVLLPDLPSQFVQQALDIIQTMEDNPKEWAESTSYLAPYISEQMLFNIFTVLSSLEPSWTHVLVFERIAPYFPQHRLNEARDLIFEASEHIIIRSELVRVLAPYLSQEILVEILTTTQRSSDTTFKPWILKAIVPHLSSTHLPQALAIAKAIPPASNRVQALCLIAESLPQELKEDAISEALAAARSADAFQVRSFSRVIPYLSPQEQTKVVDEATSALQTDFMGKYPGEDLTPTITDVANLSEQAQVKLIETLIELTSLTGAGTFDRLIMAWGKNTLSDPSDKRRFWCSILRRQCKWMYRSVLLQGLSSLAPILVQMCNPADISHIIQSVESVGEQWP